MFGALLATEATTLEALLAVAYDFSPRVELCDPTALGGTALGGTATDGTREVLLDLSGLTRLFGDAQTIASELRRAAADRGLRVRVALAGTSTAARLLVHQEPGLTVIDPGAEAATLAPLPIDALTAVATPELPPPDILTFRRWGLRTLGDLANLPGDEVAARLGQAGVAWQRVARGEDPHPLVPALPEERFEQALDLEWPIDGLEPLSFVLGRLMEPLGAHLARRNRGAAALHVRLHLVTRAVHERTLQLPTPIRDAHTLRTLALLDLEANPPAAAIDRVVVAADPTPARVLQFSLLTRALPSPEQLSTLMARLTALMGEGRCGSPVEVDSWQPGAFAMMPFAPADPDAASNRLRQGYGGQTRLCDPVSPQPIVALRRFREPVPVRVGVDEGKPSRITTDRRGLSGGRVEMCAGPWRTSGAWWESPGWDRDEWDVMLTDRATYRLFHERDTGHWFLEGLVD
jgi:protein ImuB